MNVKGFLSSCRALVQRKACSTLDDMVFMCGNDSTDMDSCVGSILFAFCLEEKNGKKIVPFINTHRPQSLAMRGDLLACLKKFDVELTDLLFLSDIITPATPSVSVFLVDHNLLAARWKLINPSLDINVIGIIDHHADEKLFTDSSNPRIVEICGCNCSLIAKYLHENNNEKLDVIKDGLLMAILTDTENLNHRVTQFDIDAVEMLMGSTVALSLDTRNEMYAALEAGAATTAGDNFSTFDLLLRDYKFFQLSQPGGFYYGISSVRILFEDRTVEEWQTAASTYMQEEGLAYLGITAYSRALQRRQLAIFFHVHSEKYPSIQLAAMEEYFNLKASELSVVHEFPNGCFWEQKNLAYSRKQTQPIFHSFLTQLCAQK